MQINKRKTIGVFITQAYYEFQDLLCRGICSRAYDLGYNVAIFSNFDGDGEYKYEKGEKNIGCLPEYEELDGIILLLDTMLINGFKSNVINNIKEYCKCPVVSVRQYMEEYQNVLIEDTTVLDDVIRHFIKDHKYTKLNFLSGPKDNPIAIERLKAYCRILSENDIPIEEDRIYHGDFWKFAAADAVDKWLADPSRRPEAIICANDYMAIAVCNALTERGILVPREIAVSGCDNIEVTKDFIPPITTIGIPVFDMGMEAVDKIHMENQGKELERTSYLKSITYIRESCGCKSVNNCEDVLRRRNYIINEVEDKDKAISNNAYMSIDLTGVTNLDVLNKKLTSYIYLNEGLSSFYMCLYKDWDKYIDDNEHKSRFFDREVSMEVGMKNGSWLQKVDFNSKELLPLVYMDEEPQFFYFNMLHHQEKCYGYAAISFKRFQAYKPSYQGWLINLCNALENIKTHNELNRLIYKLEDVSVKDELTGLYNRRALHTLGQKYLNHSIENSSALMVFSADMDNLKYINDRYGHAKGDIAIKVVADSLMNASEDDEICIRMGGDEFAVVGVEYDDNKINKFVSSFEKEIETVNQDSEYEFVISISYGWSITTANKETDLEECLGVADTKMYQQKHYKKQSKTWLENDGNHR